ncbi:SAM-dependent methyltransferase [Nonomuraea sp. NPDC026600]|uniref:SAM-dependent methyltransferase n=1 Tax=Nonomuraea sp. NPDC026600 TaxID=3155363 RepID=UPI003402AB08
MPNTPNVARIYDWFLSGKDNFAVDQAAALEVLLAYPDAQLAAIHNRSFLGRTVRYLAGVQGIDQYLDFGTGLPSMGNVHEVAQSLIPHARVVYTDVSPLVCSHARALLATDHRTVVVQEDLRNTEKVLEASSSHLDFSMPVVVLYVASLHFIEDEDDPYKIVKTVMDATAPGSFLVLSHGLSTPQTTAAAGAYATANAPAVMRSKEQIQRFFTYPKLGLIRPGLVPVPLWRPEDDLYADEDAEKVFVLGGVARKS